MILKFVLNLLSRANKTQHYGLISLYANLILKRSLPCMLELQIHTYIAMIPNRKGSHESTLIHYTNVLLLVKDLLI